MMRSQSALTAAAAMVFAASVHAGVIFSEPDAGDLPGTALAATGLGSLAAISGTTSGPDDGVDMYMIFISDPANFMASTETFNGGFANGDWDTMLWLFDADGFGVLANDDDVNYQSTISFPNSAGDPVPAPGVFFIAISGYSDKPLSASGNIFSSTSNSAPDGAGAGDPINGWSGFDGEAGSYTIALTGVSFVPTPGVLSLFGAAGLIALRRRRA